ncbi:MAG: hypothetical protein H6905_00650 [Hyphomicrobiales bacterium]|nr:hypothetical protein [Hyphomicrobiales bacterium]
MPRVRIVADYCSKGYQILEGDPVNAGDELAVSEALKSRISAWSDLYDAHCDPKAYEDVSGMRFDFVAFAAEGAAIARAVKRELPGWTVTYWDESLDWYLSRDIRSYDPSRAEYEITRKDAFANK